MMLREHWSAVRACLRGPGRPRPGGQARRAWSLYQQFFGSKKTGNPAGLRTFGRVVVGAPVSAVKEPIREDIDTCQ